ncbi:MAG: hypothetical protein Q9O24_03530 [Gammaproteobacteria bacterium]|nr:hypothetical protein [Gammaproteobacteria bacterium]
MTLFLIFNLRRISRYDVSQWLLNLQELKFMYVIQNIPENASFQLEQLGTKAKEWYFNAEEGMVLFKEGRQNTGENWAEKVCCEICRLIDLPHAEYELAVWGDRQGGYFTIICT